MYSTNIQPESEVKESLPLINPELKGRGVYQWQTSNDRGQGRIFVEYTLVHVVHIMNHDSGS